MIYLTAEELLVAARRVVGDLAVRDIDLIEAAAARPRTRPKGPTRTPTS